MANINKSCCFTGHREIPEDKRSDIAFYTEMCILDLIKQGYTHFYCGGARGFDTIAALSVKNLSYRFPHIKLILVVPHLYQADSWSENERKLYDDLIKFAYYIVLTSTRYYPGCMHVRNRYLVNKSSLCVCYKTKEAGGTKYTVDYAKNNSLIIVNIADMIEHRSENDFINMLNSGFNDTETDLL